MSKIKMSMVHGIPQEMAVKKVQIFLADLRGDILQKEDHDITAIELDWSGNRAEIKAEYRKSFKACTFTVEITKSEIILEGDLNQIIVDMILGVRHSHTGGTHFI